VSTIPSRRSFFGFAGRVDGAHGELTRQRHHLFPPLNKKRAAENQNFSLSRSWRSMRRARRRLNPNTIYVADAMDDLAAKAIIPLTASAEIIDLPRQSAR
jgi:hypothetical protein